jgi:probable phosphoglycerate mutase
MLTLYFARHGETIWNTQSRMQGRLDTALTDQGIAQALLLGDQLQSLPLERVYVSPAPRALQTARLALSVGQFPAEQLLLPDERVHEMDLGNWEGLSVDEVRSLDPVNLDHFFFAPHRFIPTGSGETYRQVSERMASFLTEMEVLGIRAAAAGEAHHILLISHNITIKALLALMRRRPLAMLRDGPPILQAALYRAVCLPDCIWQITEPELPV